MTKKIVVTGGNGFLGTAVCKKARTKGYDVISFGSADYDLRAPESVSKMFEAYKPDVMIHLAAKVGGIGANISKPGLFTYENLLMGLNVIEEARKHNLSKLVIAGTVCAYPCNCPVPFKEEDLWNGFPEPTNAGYALAKKMLLVLLSAYRQQYGLNGIFLLPTNLFGPHDSFDLENSHVIPAMIRKFHEAKIRGDKFVELWGDGTPSREFLYVEDCADAFVSAIERYNKPEPINIGNGQEIIMSDLANMIKTTTGFRGEIRWNKSKPNGQPRRMLDTNKAKKELEWEFKTPIEEGLVKTYEWFSGATSPSP